MDTLIALKCMDFGEFGPDEWQAQNSNIIYCVHVATANCPVKLSIFPYRMLDHCGWLKF